MTTLGGVTLHSLIAEHTERGLADIFAVIVAGVLVCAGELIVAKMAVSLTPAHRLQLSESVSL